MADDMGQNGIDQDNPAVQRARTVPRKLMKELTTHFASEQSKSSDDVDYDTLEERPTDSVMTERLRIEGVGPIPDAQRKLLRLLSSPKFDMVIGIVIVANAVSVGIDQSLALRNEKSVVLTWLEEVFLLVYIAELSMRGFVYGRSCLNDNWVRFDVILVVVGVLGSESLRPLMPSGSGFQPLMVLRTGRLFRLARTVRLLVKFQVLWELVRGLLNSTGTMLYTLLVLMIIIYIFSCIGLELITRNKLRGSDAQFGIIVDQYFNSLPQIMLTLVQFVCMDSIGSIYKPLVEKDITLVLYFTAIVLVVPIVLMNLVTAAIVNGALNQAAQDKEAVAIHEEQRRKKMCKDLRRIFARLDDDSSGMVTVEELLDASPEDKKVLQLITDIGDTETIFHALDVDESGNVDIDEFCDGIWSVTVSKVPIEIKRMEKQMNKVLSYMHETKNRQAALENALQRTEEALNNLTSELVFRNHQPLHLDPIPPDAPHWARIMIEELRDTRTWFGKEATAEVPSERIPQLASPHWELGAVETKARDAEENGRTPMPHTCPHCHKILSLPDPLQLPESTNNHEKHTHMFLVSSHPKARFLDKRTWSNHHETMSPGSGRRVPDEKLRKPMACRYSATGTGHVDEIV